MDLPAGPYASVAREIAGTAFGSIAYVEETASTNADAAELLDDDRFGGHTIVAEFQRRGAGRKGRLWLAAAGTALLFTTILPRTIETRNLWIVPYWVALAVRGALRDFGIKTTLQWPNDLLLGARKIAGILCQSSVIAERARVACGVGVNVKRPGAGVDIEPAPAFCDEVATVDRAALLKGILLEYDRTLGMLDRPGPVAAAWDDAAELPGRIYHIAPDDTGVAFEAVAQGLANDGGLRIVRKDGRNEIVALADVRVVRP